MDSHALAQRLRAVQGKGFEDIVAQILNEFLSPDILVVRGRTRDLDEVIGNSQAVARITNYLRIPVKRRCTQDQIQDYPDSDLVALLTPANTSGEWRVLAIVNCKVSFHARHTETCFWGSVIRSSSYIKYVCATEDRDIHGTRRRSELGDSCQKSTATRRLLECFTDRIYLVSHYNSPEDPSLIASIRQKYSRANTADVSPVFDDPTVQHHTMYCHLVRPLDDLIIDLRRWKEDIPEG